MRAESQRTESLGALSLGALSLGALSRGALSLGKCGAVLLLSLAAVSGAAVAESPQVRIKSPAAGQPLFDEVEVAAEVQSESPVEKVVFRLDGRPVRTFDRPPYRGMIDVGSENRDRLIEVEVTDALGRRSKASLKAPALRIDDGVSLELQQLYVSVTTRRGRRILTLKPKDFRIFDDDQRQEIVTFEVGDLPLTAMVLIDGSLSMEGERLESARRGVRAFADGLKELDEASLMVFTDGIEDVRKLEPGATEFLSKALAVRASGGTAINDHLFVGLQHLESRQGRRVVILLSDGRDNHSILSSEQVQRVARESQALIYWVRLQDRDYRSGVHRPSSAWRDRFGSSKEFGGLGDTVRESGGKIITLRRDDEIEPAFRVILAELREQYALGYYPSPEFKDGRWRKVRIDVAGRGLKVRVRDGYYDR